MARNELSRRAFLARTGVLGAGTRMLPRFVAADRNAAAELGSLVDVLRPVVGQLTRDTLNGFIAFVVPGNDEYSRAQGTPRDEAGGIAAGGTEFLVESLDRFPPFSIEAARPAASALITALGNLPMPMPGRMLGGILGPPVETIGLLEDAVLFLVENDPAAPLSLPVALLLNYVATVVSPSAFDGAMLSPFARLSFAQKARAMEMLETTQSPLIALIDTQVPEPLTRPVAGLLRFIGIALHEFAAFGSIGEAPQLDPAVRSLIGEPLGGFTGVLPEILANDGWDELLASGYAHAALDA
jgi:hypothetical protein